MPRPSVSDAARRSALYFVGIGGAGLSAYANLARAWGAEVARLGPRATRPYLERARRASTSRSAASRSPPDGWEVVVSTAHRGRVAGTLARRLPRRARRRCAARSSSAARTARRRRPAMIAFVLARARPRPGVDHRRRVVPQLGGNAGAGEGWLVVEGDESDRIDRALCGREIAVVTNVELDHHATFALARPRSRRSSTRWLAERAAGRPRLGARAGRRSSSRCRASTTARNAAAALAALELAGVDARRRRARARAVPRAPAAGSSSSASAAA